MQSKSKYRAVIIGCGRIGVLAEAHPRGYKHITHAGVFARHPRIEFVGMADIDPAKLALAKRIVPGVPLFSDARTLLKETVPDIVVVATPDETHWPVIREAVAFHPRLIIGEKPIALSLSDGEKIVASCKRARVQLIVNYMRRFDPAFTRLREDIRRGKLGSILQVRCLYTNGLVNNGTHVIDFLRWYFGDMREVHGWRNPNAYFSRKQDYNIDARLLTKGGVRIMLQTLDIKSYGIFDIEIYGTEKAVAIRDRGLVIDTVPLQKSRHYTFKRELGIDRVSRVQNNRKTFFESTADHAVAVLDGKAKPLSTGESALENLRTALAIRESAARNGQKVIL